MFRKIVTMLIVITFLLIPVYSFTYDSDSKDEADTKEEIAEKERDTRKYQSISEYSVSIFSLGDGLGRCSGVIIGESSRETYVLTCKHCLNISEEFYVENNKVKLIITSATDDLAYLIVDGKIRDKYPVRLSPYQSKLKEKVYHVAYPDFDIYESKGNVFKYTDDWGWAKMNVRPGCSGGGIFNEYEELIGIVWGALANGEDITLFEPLNDIKEFLSEVENLEIKKIQGGGSL